MTSQEENSNILEFKKSKQLNIGIVIFGVIFIYLIATIIMYVTAPRITIYEVRQGSILKDTAYTGVALRQEQVVYADEAGYVNYYVDGNHKVRVGTNVYTISSQPLEFKNITTTEALELTSEQTDTLQRKVQTFNEQFEENNFSTIYQLKDEVKNTLDSIVNQSKLSQLNDLLATQSVSNMKAKPVVKDGVVVFAVDGLESLTAETIQPEHFSKANYEKTTFSNNTQVSMGSPVYKIVTSETWSLALDLKEETAAALQDQDYVRVHFKKDDQVIWADLQLSKKEDKNIAILSFHDSMVRYADERYLDIELILEDESGLKIPKSAETTKEFYVVPRSYITQGGNSSDDGVMRKNTDKNGNTITEFYPVTIYYEENETVYLDPDAFEPGDILIKPESSETFQPHETKSLKGVYCINKGYAVFKQIKILCESDEYYIIEEGNDFGLSNYDHIALDSKNIHENDVVF